MEDFNANVRNGAIPSKIIQLDSITATAGNSQMIKND